MPRLLHHISVRYPKSIYLTPFKGCLTAFNLFESLEVGNLLSILLLLNW